MKRARIIHTTVAMSLMALNLVEAKHTDLFFDYSRKIRVNIPPQQLDDDENTSNAGDDDVEEVDPQKAIEELFETVINKLLESYVEGMTTSDLLSLSIELPNNATQNAFDDELVEMLLAD